MQNHTLEQPAPATIAAPPAAPKKRSEFAKPDAESVAQLVRFKTERNLTHDQIGVMLGVHESYVSKFIRGKNDFDPVRMQAAVQDLLKSEALRSGDAIELFPTFISQRISGAFDKIRKTGDIGLIFAAAGLGKTSAMALECQSRPLTLSITASKGNASASDIEGMIFALIETKEWDRQSKRRNFIVQRTKDSRRLLMIDNAQRLTSDSLKYIFDLHDQTGLPIAFLGNPEVEIAIRRNDQLFSRIGIKPDLRVWNDGGKKLVSDSEMEAVADGILQRMIPEWHATIRDLAVQIVWQQGHFRALRKTITLAHELAQAGGKLADPRTAFAAAHKMLPRNYSLDGV